MFISRALSEVKRLVICSMIVSLSKMITTCLYSRSLISKFWLWFIPIENILVCIVFLVPFKDTSVNSSCWRYLSEIPGSNMFLFKFLVCNNEYVNWNSCSCKNSFWLKNGLYQRNMLCGKPELFLMKMKGLGEQTFVLIPIDVYGKPLQSRNEPKKEIFIWKWFNVCATAQNFCCD